MSFRGLQRNKSRLKQLPLARVACENDVCCFYAHVDLGEREVLKKSGNSGVEFTKSALFGNSGVEFIKSALVGFIH